MNVFVKIIQGALIGAGGVLPGVSGGVLAVLFGVYKPLMRLLAHPLHQEAKKYFHHLLDQRYSADYEV